MCARGNGAQTGNSQEVVEVTGRRSRRARLSGIAGLVLAGLVILTPAGGTLAQQLGRDGSPARGHAQVIAQSLIRVSGPVEWQVTQESAGTEASREKTVGPGFLLGADGAVLITDVAAGHAQRIAVGEATEVVENRRYERSALGGDEATFFEISLVDSDKASNHSLSFKATSLTILTGSAISISFAIP